MKRVAWSFILAVAALPALAKEGSESLSGIYNYTMPVTHMNLLEEPGVANAQLLAQWAGQRLPELERNGILLQFTESKATPAGTYSHFQPVWRGRPVYGQRVSIMTDLAGNIRQFTTNINDAFNGQTAAPQWAQVDSAGIVQRFLQQWKGAPLEVNYSQVAFVNGSQVMQPGIELRGVNVKAGVSATYLLDQQGQVAAWFSNNRYATKDSILQSMVFVPDPLTSSHQYYGGTYVDNNDQDATWLTDARVPVDFMATWDITNNNFILENPMVKIETLNGSLIQPQKPTTNQAYYTRSQRGFEECMMMYHISTMQEHIQALGFNNIMNRQILADPHYSTQDNSFFSVDVNGQPFLAFGTGGVDDAEDADVIVHEYGHSLSWDATGVMSNQFSTERFSLDEGLGDYFATSYSRNIDTFRWKDMFTWDGHNEYWEGRTADYSAKYPLGPTTIHKNGQIWSTAMMGIWGDAGRDVTDKLMLQALYGLQGTTTFPQAAQLVLQADTLLYGAAHANILCRWFTDRNILSTCGGWVTGLSPAAEAPRLQVVNSAGFAAGTGPVSISWPGIGAFDRAVLTNISGQVLQAFNGIAQRDQLQVQDASLAPGVYILELSGKGGAQRVKLVRW
jgi:hypothetical protein